MDSSKFKELGYIIVFLVASICVYAFKEVILEPLTGLPSYIAIFALSFIGACSIIAPIPYTVIVFVLASSENLDPLMMAITGGLGSGLGEFTGWIVGKLVSRTLESTRYSKQLHALIRFAEAKGKHVLPLVIFIFALTPLPDDMLFIVLGMLNYKLLYTLIPCVIGKVVMLYLVSSFGKLTWGIIGDIGLSEEIIIVLTVIMLAAIFVALMFIKWDKILENI